MRKSKREGEGAKKMSRKANWRCESDSIEEGDEEKQAREASL